MTADDRRALLLLTGLLTAASFLGAQAPTLARQITRAATWISMRRHAKTVEEVYALTAEFAAGLTFGNGMDGIQFVQYVKHPPIKDHPFYWYAALLLPEGVVLTRQGAPIEPIAQARGNLLDGSGWAASYEEADAASDGFMGAFGCTCDDRGHEDLS